MGRVGRPSKPYRTSWCEDVSGLTRCTEVRWRIAATEQRFSEVDERLAVIKAKAIIAAEHPPEKIEVKRLVPIAQADAVIDRWNSSERVNGQRLLYDTDGTTFVQQHDLDADVVWPCRRELLNKTRPTSPAWSVCRRLPASTTTRSHPPPRSG